MLAPASKWITLSPAKIGFRLPPAMDLVFVAGMNQKRGQIKEEKSIFNSAQHPLPLESSQREITIDTNYQ